VLLLWAGWLTTGAWLLVIAPIVVSALILVPPWQRRLARQRSAIAVQHRIRGVWSASSLYGPDGEVPLLLWTRVVADGERIYLWSPPSLTANAFRAESARLAEVCRSQSIRVHGHSRFTRVVILDVVRRGSSPVATVVPAVMMIPRPRQRQEV
jgi:hypothetical protein